MHFHHDPDLRPDEIQLPTRHQQNHLERFLRLQRALRRAGTALGYAGAAFPLIILYGTYLTSRWLQAASR